MIDWLTGMRWGALQGYGTGKGAGYTPIVGNFFVTV